jgi:uncharacterized protein DUF4845
MRNRQRGITLMGLLAGSVVVIFVALLGMKLAPSYIEYFAIKKAVNGITHESRGGGSAVSDLRRAFDARAAIDDFTAVKATDLEITKEGNGYTVTAAYRKEVPLFANIGVYIEFTASASSN